VSAFAPGKLILSGEHSVVYGRPALAMAIPNFIETTVEATVAKTVFLDLSDLHLGGYFEIKTLYATRNRLLHRHKQFSQGKLHVGGILDTPFDLAQFALMQLMGRYGLPGGLSIKINSSIPIGCGLGSSSALILSILRAIANHMGISLGDETYINLGREAESLQHGVSSGLDLAASLNGGHVCFQEGKVEKRSISKVPMFLVNTGPPATHTGETVEKVSQRWARDNSIWDSFASVTREMGDALRPESKYGIGPIIRENHRLLVRIGVVPEKVQIFIKELETAGAAAKICGAGAARGDNAGAVLIIADSSAQVGSVCKKYGYKINPVHAEPRGLYAA